MTSEEILNLWNDDADIDGVNLDNVSLNIGKLHNKYYRIYIDERRAMIALEAGLKELSRDKSDWYGGVIDRERLDARGWPQFQRTVLKGDREALVQSDPEVLKVAARVAMQKDKLEMLKSILEMVKGRSYHIRDAIDWRKFQAGG
jgi:hypothetical protein